MKRALFVASLLVASLLLLTGCLSTAAQRAEWNARELQNRADHQFIYAYNTCVKETGWFGLIPDAGITRDQHFFKCMDQAGWIQEPLWNPRTIGAFRRKPLKPGEWAIYP